MIEIRYVKQSDQSFWFQLDHHLSSEEFLKKVRDHQGFVLFEDGKPKGILRYNLFWDNIPFCTLLFINQNDQNKGFGTQLMSHWEQEMKQKGYGMVLVSTQVDEDAQHFYRKLGYQDCGSLIINIPHFEQPAELFLTKKL